MEPSFRLPVLSLALSFYFYLLFFIVCFILFSLSLSLFLSYLEACSPSRRGPFGRGLLCYDAD